MQSILNELIFQYDNVLHVLAVTIRPLSRKQWIAGAIPSQMPARQVFHILWGLELHATGQLDGCQRRFGCSANDLDTVIPPEQLPGVNQALSYLDEVHAIVHSWLSSLDDTALLDPTPAHGWSQRGPTRLGHITYVLRHATFHLGQLCSILDGRGLHYGVFK
jgi:hypothetical protein